MPKRRVIVWMLALGIDLLNLILFSWDRDIQGIILGTLFFFAGVALVHSRNIPPRDNDDDNEFPDGPDYPYGNVVDQWLRSRGRILA